MTKRESSEKSSSKDDKSKKGNRPKAVKSSIKPKKEKLIEYSFALPKSEYKLIGEIKKRCIARKIKVKKHEILQAAIRGLWAQKDALIVEAVKTLEPLKSGRLRKGNEKK